MKQEIRKSIIPENAKLQNLNFNPLDVLSWCYDPQLHVGEKYMQLSNLNQNIRQYNINPYSAGINFSRQNLTSVD